jgi:hypothetical protein
MSNYNPYTASLSAIATELTSDRAKQYYANRAQQDTQMVVDAALTAGIAVYQAAVFTYQLGAFVRAWMDATEQAAIECTAIVHVAPAAIASAQTPDEIIEGEIVEEPIVYQLAPAIAPNLGKTVEQVVMAAICDDLVMGVAYAEAQKFIAASAKTKTAAKTKTSAKKRAPKADPKTAMPAPRKNPTRATVGNLTLSID